MKIKLNFSKRMFNFDFKMRGVNTKDIKLDNLFKNKTILVLFPYPCNILI